MAEIRQENDSESSDVDILEVSLHNFSIEGKLNEFYTICMSHFFGIDGMFYISVYRQYTGIVSRLCYCFYLSQNQQITFKILYLVHCQYELYKSSKDSQSMI